MVIGARHAHAVIAIACVGRWWPNAEKKMVPSTATPSALESWREDLRSFAHGLRAMTLHHPWMAAPSAGLRSFGPKTAGCYERVLTAVDGLGLEIDEMLVMVETLDAYVRGRVLEELSEEAVRRSGLDQEQWMQTQIPYIQSLIESGHYPVLTRVVLDARAPHDPDRLRHGFDLGLERVLDGLATTLPE